MLLLVFEVRKKTFNCTRHATLL